MSTRPDVLIVGAGIVGAACALELAASGLSVRVIDRGPVAGGTTAAAMGHVVVMDDSTAQGDLTHWSRQLWDVLAPTLPGIEHDPCDTIWVATDDEELAAKRAAYPEDGRHQLVRSHGPAAGKYSPNQLKERSAGQ